MIFASSLSVRPRTENCSCNFGGGISLGSGGLLTLDNCTVSGNHADGLGSPLGGGLYLGTGVRVVALLLPLMSAVCFGVVAVLRKIGLSGMAPIPGFAVNDIRTLPLETRATLLAILCAGATDAAPARAARTTAVVPASDVI